MAWTQAPRAALDNVANAWLGGDTKRLLNLAGCLGGDAGERRAGAGTLFRPGAP